jgi:hypothetical protein
MRNLFLLLAITLIGLIVMSVSSQEMLDEMQQQKAASASHQGVQGIEPVGQARLQVWLASGFFGFVLFSIGGVASVVIAFRMIREGF